MVDKRGVNEKGRNDAVTLRMERQRNQTLGENGTPTISSFTTGGTGVGKGEKRAYGNSINLTHGD